MLPWALLATLSSREAKYLNRVSVDMYQQDPEPVVGCKRLTKKQPHMYSCDILSREAGRNTIILHQCKVEKVVAHDWADKVLAVEKLRI